MNIATATAVQPQILYTSDEVFEIIEQIAAASGKEKETALAEHIHCEFLQRVLKAALCPFTTYGVKKLPEAESNTSNEFDAGTWGLLTDLQERRLTGNNAQKAIQGELERLSEASGTLLRRILTKDMRAGFTAKTVNRVKLGSIFIFECMLAHKFEEKRIKQWPVACEPKLDGVRVLGIYSAVNKTVRFYSRTGKEFTSFRHIGEAMAAQLDLKHDRVFDGEIMDRAGSFNQIVGDVHRKDQQAENAIFNLFDAMPESMFSNGGCDIPYRARRSQLAAFYERYFKGLESVSLVPVKLFDNVDDILAMHADILAAGGEGVIVKPLDGPYETKRSYSWLKIKDQQTIDLPIIGFERGTGKYADTLGKLVCDYNGVEVKASGMTDAMRDEFWNNQEKYRQQMVELHYHEVTADLSLRHPRFKRLRLDKPIEDGAGV